jgi:phytoene desaturase
MARVAKARGAEIVTNAEVVRVRANGRTAAVELASGETVHADEVVMDADAAEALTHLLEDDVSLRFSKHRLEHLTESCSTFMLYLGIDRELPLDHHTFFFAADYVAEMDRVFREGTLSDDVSVYACNPVRSDPTVAPAGHSALYLLALAPNTRSAIDWEIEGPRMRKRVLDALALRTGVDVRPHIREERCVTPTEWETRYRISHGAVFGPAHEISQLLALRPPHRLPSPGNVFLSGAGTSPGSGIPTVLESARITTRLLCEKHGIAFPASRPLPEPTTWKRRTSARADLPSAPFEAEYLDVV